MEPFKSSDNSHLFRDRSPDAVALDNLIRKALRVSDPTNAGEIAAALGNYYTTDRDVMAREAAGVPFVTTLFKTAEPQAVTSTGAEIDQAVRDVDRDLSALIADSTLKDIEPELKGWSTTIRTAIADGLNAARFSLDPRQRDSAFGVRRLLGNYARMARYIGALTPAMSRLFRSFAQSVDEVSSLLLVIIGETIANTGIGGGSFILQAPVSEIQARRDAVIYALRNLAGSTQEAYGPNDWPRGLQAYQQFIERLGTNAQHDLRALFQENELARMMDELIHQAVGNSSDGYRALGSTALITLERFNRLILFGRGLVDPESPPLAAFLMSLKLFLDAFDNGRRGYRLLTIARPPILFYGLYGMKQDDASRRLLNLIILRGNLAELLDCVMGCGCNDADNIRSQIVLDKALYDVDRAVDLYALGVDDFSEPEQRAAAYGYIVNEILKNNVLEVCGVEGRIVEALRGIKDQLWFHPFTPADFSDLPLECNNVRQNIHVAASNWDAQGTLRASLALTQLYDGIRIHFGLADDEDIPEADVPASIRKVEKMMMIIEQELCAQANAEKNWETLLESMAPSCFKWAGNTDNPSIGLISGALKTFRGLAACKPFDVDIPPHYETSLAGITYSRWSEGGNS